MSEPERTAETIDMDGFLHFGDLGEMDAKGNDRITGRIKDMIIRDHAFYITIDIKPVLQAGRKKSKGRDKKQQ